MVHQNRSKLDGELHDELDGELNDELDGELNDELDGVLDGASERRGLLDLEHLVYY